MSDLHKIPGLQEKINDFILEFGQGDVSDPVLKFIDEAMRQALTNIAESAYLEGYNDGYEDKGRKV